MTCTNSFGGLKFKLTNSDRSTAFHSMEIHTVHFMHSSTLPPLSDTKLRTPN